MTQINKLGDFNPSWTCHKKSQWIVKIELRPAVNPLEKKMFRLISELQDALNKADFKVIQSQRYLQQDLREYSPLEAFTDFRNTTQNFTIGKFLDENIDEVGNELSTFSHYLRLSTPQRVDRNPIRMGVQKFSEHCRNLIKFVEIAWPKIKKDHENRATVREAKKIAREAQESIKAIRTAEQQATSSKQRIDAAVSGASLAVGDIGLAAEAERFEKEAGQHARNGCSWLIVAVILAIVILIVAAYFYFIDQPVSTAELERIDWNNFIPKLSTLTILIVFEIIVIANYRAERHNYIVNRHRSNALTTSRAIISAPENQDIRDSITLVAAGAIYAPQDTGFSRRTTPQQLSAADILGSMANRNSD